MEILTKNYINFLIHEINIRSEQSLEPTVENIVENLFILTKKGNTEDSKLWLPIEIKRVLLYILYDGEALIDTAITEFVPQKYCIATTTITVKDTTISKATRRIAFDDVEPFAGLTDSKRNVIMQDLACGSSETYALTKAGIGMEFTGDLRDYSCKELSAGNDQQQNNSPVEFHPELADKMNQILDETPKSSGDNNNSSENMIIPFGPQKGKTLKELPPETSTKYIGWMLACIDTKKQTVNPEFRNMLVNIVESDPACKKIYNLYMNQALSNS